MKHIFIVNPASGKENATDRIRTAIEASSHKDACELYITTAPEDAIRYIRAYCADHTDPVRFYACGGDGTLNEVANAVAAFPFAALGCFPCGSGNDFVKYYGGTKPFLNLDALIQGEETPIDLIRVGDKYAINATHFGFDSSVAQTICDIRRKPIIGGRNAYPSAVIKGLFTARKHICTVEADGEVINPQGTLLLCTIANGQYVGGSYRCAPRSKNDDGLLDVCLIDPITLLKFFQVFSHYRDGSHLSIPAYQSFIHFKRAKTIHVKATPNFVYAMDGEPIKASEFTAEVVPAATRFILPKGATPIACIPES